MCLPALRPTALFPTTQQSGLLTRRWYLFIAAALLVRGLYIGIQLHYRPNLDLPGLLSLESGDTKGYLDPVENLIEHGRFEPDYRMPGVAAPYWIFRQFLEVGASRDAMVLLQWLLSGINVYLLALIAWRMTGSERIALLVFLTFLASAYSSWFDPIIASDSLSISALIFHVHFLQSALDKRSRGRLLLSGTFLAWFVFLRPIGVLLVPLASALMLWRGLGPRPWRSALLLALPFLVLDGAWTARNFSVHGSFSPLTNQGWFPEDFSREIRAHAMHFVQGYGGNYIWWDPGSDIRWYGVWKGGATIDDEGRLAKEPPAYAFVEGYSLEDLRALSERVRDVENGRWSTADSLAEIASINARFDELAALYQEGAPFQYHVLSRFRMFKNLVWQNGTESLIIIPFKELSLGAKLFKLLQVAMYVFAFTIGVIACVVLLWRWRRPATVLHVWIPFIVAYLVLIFPFALRMCEWRYMAHPFPFALLLAVILVARKGRLLEEPSNAGKTSALSGRSPWQ